MQLEAISCYPITSYLGEEINTLLTTASFQVVVESNKVPPHLQHVSLSYFVITYFAGT